MSHYHAVVWNSRKSAHGGHKSAADRHFFDDVVHSLEGAHEILVIGPAQTKQEFADRMFTPGS
jgi:stalled ribosome rescue protein Dom34